jgi:DNA-binding MarR family transcriptional regulator
MDTVPLIMRFIRSQMRCHRIAGLSVTQFRVLLFISRCSGASLSAAAEHVGLSLPAVSRMADKLATRNLLARHRRVDDRRGVSLAVTPRGERALSAAFQATQADLAEKLGILNAGQRATVIRSMQALRPVFTASIPAKPRSAR